MVLEDDLLIVKNLTQARRADGLDVEVVGDAADNEHILPCRRRSSPLHAVRGTRRHRDRIGACRSARRHARRIRANSHRSLPFCRSRLATARGRRRHRSSVPAEHLPGGGETMRLSALFDSATHSRRVRSHISACHGRHCCVRNVQWLSWAQSLRGLYRSRSTYRNRDSGLA